MVNAVKNPASNSISNQVVIQTEKNRISSELLSIMVVQSHNKSQPIRDFLNKLSKFNPNESLMERNNSPWKFVSSMRSNQALQASALVGRQILMNNDTLVLGVKNDVFVAVDVPVGVSGLKASIYAKSGQLIKNVYPEHASPGFFQFTWNGNGENGERYPAGQYKIKVYGIFNGQELALKTMTSANIDSVSLAQNGKNMRLNIAGSGFISLDLET